MDLPEGVGEPGIQGSHLRCIFCLEDRRSSDEHVFPTAVGGTLVIDRVCKPCNDRLGSEVDTTVASHGAVLMRRHLLEMRDGSGKPVSPWGTVFRQAAVSGDPDMLLDLITDPITGTISHRVRYGRREVVAADGSRTIQITIDAGRPAEIPKIIARERRRANQPALSPAEMDLQVAAVLSNVRTIDRPSLQMQIAVDIAAFARGLMKIAYELAWLWLGEEYLNDPGAIRLRDAVLKGTEGVIRGTAVLGADLPPINLWQHEPDTHLAFLSGTSGGIFVAVRVFNILCGVFEVSERLDSYPVVGRGHFLRMLPNHPPLQSSMSAELMRLVAAKRTP